MPSLYPVQLPFRVQHSILTSIQRFLEECCYEFTQKYAPNLLIDEKWDCAEAIELNKWTVTILRRHGKLPTRAFRKPDHDVHQILLDVANIRHAAVHRMRMSAEGLVQMVDTAIRFVRAFSDTVRALQLGELYRELKSKVKSQELNKNYLETKLRYELEAIEYQREVLAKRRRDAISSAATEDRDHMHFVGSLLEDNLRNTLKRDNSDDQVNSDNPENLRENDRDQTTNGNFGLDNMSYEPDSSQVDAIDIEISRKSGDEGVSPEIASRGSIGKENGVSF